MEETEETEGKKFERREARILSDYDVEAIAVALSNHRDACKFGDIEPGDLKAMVDSHKKFNLAMDDSKTIARRFFLVLIMAAISGYAVNGYWAKVVEHVKKAVSN
jgi:hypothetical protein